MSRLQEFLNSIALIIYEYCKTQNKSPNSETFEDLILKPHPEMISALKKMISESTAEYPLRAPLLMYYLYIINIINPMVTDRKPFTADEIKLIRHSLLSFLNNLCSLMGGSKQRSVLVNYDDTQVALQGFKRFNLLCCSGQLIQSKLFNPFAINPKITDLQYFINHLIDEHQNPLTKIARLEIDLVEQNQGFEKQLAHTEAILAAEKKISSLLGEQNKSLLHELADLREQLSTANEEIQHLQVKIKSLTHQIESLQNNKSPAFNGMPMNLMFSHMLFKKQGASPALNETAETDSLNHSK